MRNKIFGMIGILWGGAILISFFARGMPVGGGSYAAGAIMGLLFGILLLVSGIYYIKK